MKHSPMPWTKKKSAIAVNNWPWMICDNEGDIIATGLSEADADLILAAVNAYPAQGPTPNVQIATEPGPGRCCGTCKHLRHYPDEGKDDSYCNRDGINRVTGHCCNRWEE